MRRIVLDIETCAYPFESLAESQQEYLLRYAEKETDPGKKQEQTDQAIRYTSLYPLTAKCVAIGIYDIDKNLIFSTLDMQIDNIDKEFFFKGSNSNSGSFKGPQAESHFFHTPDYP